MSAILPLLGVFPARVLEPGTPMAETVWVPHPSDLLVTPVSASSYKSCMLQLNPATVILQLQEAYAASSFSSTV
jgi:hypothetical protein